uniref:hypothetical protein n=1 Tax=Rheinheimera sp. TaxID=1869214 RepID=UPI004048C568
RRESKAAQTSGLVQVSARQAESNLAQKVVKLTKLVKGLKPEVKYVDTSLTTNNVPVATGSVILLSGIAGGTGVNQRVGDLVTSLWWNLNVSLTNTSSFNATNENPSYRFYIVRDNQQVGDTAPTGADLVDQPSLPKIQLLNVATTMQKRFQVLFDSKPQILFAGTGVAAQNNSVVFPAKLQFNIKGRKKAPIRFNGTAASDIQKGGLYLFFYTDVVVAAADALDFTGTSRVAYHDV